MSTHSRPNPTVTQDPPPHHASTGHRGVAAQPPPDAATHPALPTPTVVEQHARGHRVDSVVFGVTAAIALAFVVWGFLSTDTLGEASTTALDWTVVNVGWMFVVLASTSEVYGKNAQVPFTEEHDLVMGPTLKHRWAYACSKALDEFLALAYYKEKHLPVIIVRLFNTVGPRQSGRYGMVIPTFVRQALLGHPITIHGDGTQSRSFTFVGDVVRALQALVEEPRAVGQVFNIGNGEEITINALAEKIKAATGSHSPIVRIPYDDAYESGFEDMARRVPDISKIRALVGYEPHVGLDQILDDVIAYMRA